MQDCYAGDIGDFAKFGLLRALSKGRRLGVAWYLNPHPDTSSAGEDVGYLFGRKDLRSLDPELFDAMRHVVCADHRCVAAIESSGILRDAVFAAEPICRSGRDEWFERTRGRLADCDVVFADPDNGLCSDGDFRPSARASRKQMQTSEAMGLAAKGRTAIIHHHNGRKVPQCEEIKEWMSQLPGCSHAYYWRRRSNRTFFILNPDEEIRIRLRTFEKRWKECGQLFT